MTPKEPNPGYFGTGVAGYQDKQRCFQDSLSPFSLQLLTARRIPPIIARHFHIEDLIREATNG
jgi:hypothetical protein